MEPSGGNMLTVYDYVVMAITLGVCAGIGVVTGRRKSGESNTVVNYLLAGRTMAVIPVAFSIMATIMSGIAMSGGIGEMYLYGAQFQFVTFSSALGKLAVAQFIVPVLHQMQYVSIYEYLELRFDKVMRILFSVVYLMGNIFYLGVVLYVPAISLTTVTGIPYMLTSSVTGVICVFYCVAGGYKAVIWTDVLQTVLMFTCFLLILVKGSYDLGGISKAISDSHDGDRMHIDWTEDGETRYSMWSLSAAGLLMAAKNYSTNQAGVQRLLSVKSASDAKKSVYLSTVLMLIFKVMIILSGFVIYAYFKDCDPIQSPGLESSDQILVYAAGVMLHDIPGLAGIALSGIVSGSLSTISSYINAFAALTLEDYLKPLFPKMTENDTKNIFICKILTAFYGIVTILISFLIPFLGGAVKSYNTVVATLGGPLIGVMFLGMFAPRTSTKVCKLALAISISFVVWLALGSHLFAPDHRTLSVSTEGCSSINGTLINSYTSTEATSALLEHPSAALYFFPFYKLSFMWFGSLGVVLTVILGLTFSLFYPNKEDTDPRLLSPLVVRNKNNKKNEMTTVSGTAKSIDKRDSVRL